MEEQGTCVKSEQDVEVDRSAYCSTDLEWESDQKVRRRTMLGKRVDRRVHGLILGLLEYGIDYLYEYEIDC